MPAISISSVPTTRKGGGAFMNAVRALADADLQASGETIDTVAQVLIGGNAWSTGRAYDESLTSNSGAVYAPNYTAAYVHREILARVVAKFPTVQATAHNRANVGFIVPTL